MLMTQMKFQDPMSPMSNEQFASQMAQFSSLQELQSIGASLQQSIQANLLMSQSFNNTMASSLIGKFITAENDQVQMSGSSSVHLDYRLSGAATSINVDIRDKDGVIVRTLKVNPQEAGDRSISWDGMDADGQRVPDGAYTFAVQATDANGATVTATTFVQGIVDSVRYEDGNVLLRVGDRDIQLSQVMSLANSGGKG